MLNKKYVPLLLGGGGAPFPPSRGDIQQWMLDTSDDGTMNDKIDPAILDLAVVGAVNALSWNGSTSVIDTGIAAPLSVSTVIDYTVTFIMPVLPVNSYGVIGSGITSSSHGIQIRSTGIAGGVRGTSGDVAYFIHTVVPAQGGLVTVRFLWNGVDTVFLTVNGSTESEVNTPIGNISDVDNIKIGSDDGCIGGVEGFFLGNIISASCATPGCKFNYSIQEGNGATIYDISGNENHGTASNTTWTTAEGSPSHNLQYGFFRVSSLYSVTIPNGGFDRTYDPTTASMGESFDVLATVVNDSAGASIGSWNVTNPAGLRTFNPNAATTGNFMDVLSTIANEISGTANAYTLTEPSGGRIRAYNPNTDSSGVAYDVLASLLLDMQESGYIG